MFKGHTNYSYAHNGLKLILRFNMFLVKYLILVSVINPPQFEHSTRRRSAIGSILHDHVNIMSPLLYNHCIVCITFYFRYYNITCI